MKLLIVFLLFAIQASAQTIHFPLKASDNKKYIVDQENKPVFLNGCASWRLGYAVTYAAAKKYLTDRKAKGYNTLIVEISPDMPGANKGNVPNVYGDSIFHNADVSLPNEKFFSHTDSILKLCADMNFAVLLSPLYLGCCKDGWVEIIQQQPNTVQKCYDYGKWVATRYNHLSNIIWMSGGDEYATAAINKEGTSGVLYMPTYRTVSVNMARFRAAVTVKWLDPSSGKYTTLPTKYPNKGVVYLTPPSKMNSKGFDDWVLVVNCIL
jgi:Protein of unknown function (DUF4038)/Putative collagen-binding domain of a collagenase